MPEDRDPVFTVNLEREFEIPALRIIFSEQNLDVQNNVPITPVKYIVRFLDKEKKELDFCIDASSNKSDILNVFKSFAPVMAQYVQVVIKNNNSPVLYGITDLAVFVRPRNVNS
jgi:hypothetical protein